LLEVEHISLAAAERSEFGTSSSPASGEALQNRRTVVIGRSELEDKIKKTAIHWVLLQGGCNS
jgi:hypothetical protein